MVNKNLKKILKNLPRSTGVYLFKDKKGDIIYIGKAINLWDRVKSYFSNPNIKSMKIIKETYKVDYIQVFSDFECLLLEAELVKKYKPKFNTKLKDDKSFLYIGITDEEFPKVCALRKNETVNLKKFFGPFPSANTVKTVLKLLRKIFPYCSQKSNRQVCFWHGLGLCSPCPGEIIKLSGVQRQEKKKKYLENINNLIDVLSGKSKRIIIELKRKMLNASQSENYEEAAIIRDQIKKLNWLISSHIPTSFYIENPNFYEDYQKNELEDLYLYFRKFLKNFSYPHRIECYDISNISGNFATGAMAVLTEGLLDKKEFRRFKIKKIVRNDPAMIAEILERRLNHKEWPLPNFIIIDGGKPQINEAIKILKKYKVEIPVVGFAKKFEEIIFFENNSWRVERLSKNLLFLNLLRRIRDEAHRFALTYHKKIRFLV